MDIHFLGERDSHTLLFEARHNWTGLLVEPMVDKYQCWSELFELFNYSNSKDRIVVFGIRIRSVSGFRILFELFE